MEDDAKSMNVVQQRELNGLGYEMIPSTSVAVSRTFERQFFQKNSYAPSQEALCDMNTGAKFVNSRRSYLTFKVTATKAGGNDATFGIGSACNLIKRVVITSRSGVELSRTEDFNVYSAQSIPYSCSKEYIDQFGPLMGYGATFGAAGSLVVCIPLTILSPFFIGDGKTLLPPQAAAGLRVQITFESTIRAFVDTTAPPAGQDPDNRITGYTIDDISIMANTTSMVDSWQRALNQESAAQGLTYSYPEIYTTTSDAPAASTRVNIEQRKAVARALSAWTAAIPSTDALGTDSMKPVAYGYSEVQWRLGSLYPTQQKIVTPQEAYWVAQNSVDGGLLDCKRMNAVSLEQFLDGTHSVTSVSLERNDVSINGVLNISGLSTNNSRVLSVDQNFSAPLPAGVRTYMFMKHLRLGKYFLDNCALSE